MMTAAVATNELLEFPVEIAALDAPVIFFPVRHHSPTAARLVRELIETRRPAAVLIEGPADFSPRMAELALPHTLPIAIYSYVRSNDGRRRGAYYPFCVYSPEWQAILAGRSVGAEVRFIDLPFAESALFDEMSNRYADAELRRSGYIRELCRRLGVEGFDAVWDTMFELDATLSVEKYLQRAHYLCGHIRMLEGDGPDKDQRREAYMAAEIRSAMDTHAGGGRQVLVVTGGFHSLALFGRLRGRVFPADSAMDVVDPTENDDATSDGLPDERGIALTPYSYARLDALKGYDAGMPNPGFYDRLWHDRAAARAGGGGKKTPTHRRLLFEVAKILREKKQRVSSADLIAAQTCAESLANMRGHDEVWRTDLVDGLAGALLKDDVVAAGGASGGGAHPMLDAVHEVLRGNARGTLAEGTALPPLVVDMQRQLAEAGLTAETVKRRVELNLLAADDRVKSALLHRLAILGVAGYGRVGGTDFVKRGEMADVSEAWDILWSPEFDATAIEAARYGPSVAEAAVARLTEQAGESGAERSAEKCAVLLLSAGLAGLQGTAATLFAQVTSAIRRDGEFLSVTAALGHLLYLYRYDEALGTTGNVGLAALLAETFDRALWLLEILGQIGGEEEQVVTGVKRIVETFERCADVLPVTRAELAEVLGRVQQDAGQLPAVRGAAVGAKWTLGVSNIEQVRTTLKLFADPEKLGDFLAGLFGLARETVQRHRELILAIDEMLCRYGEEEFFTALPPLRLAFTYFTPREKHHLGLNLMESLGVKRGDAPARLQVNIADAARALAMESRLFAAAARFGLRGATP